MIHHDSLVTADCFKSQYRTTKTVEPIYQTLERRLRGLNLQEQEDFFYPVRAYLNRPIIYTDPDEMIAKGKNRPSLCHRLETVENAIAQGQLMELYRYMENALLLSPPDLVEKHRQSAQALAARYD